MKKQTKSNERTCIVCRTVRSQDDLVQVGLWQGQPVVSSSAPGRHCYVCIEKACIFSLGPKSLSRSFRTNLQSVNIDAFAAAAHELGRARVLAALGLAQRSGSAVCGVDAVRSKSEEYGATVVAGDLAERSKKRLGTRNAVVMQSAETLGSALGRAAVGAVWVPAGRHAHAIRYWGRVMRATEQNEKPTVAALGS